MSGGFERAVVGAIQAVGFGELATYGEIAEEAGHPRAGRAVGNVLAGSEGLPWWRIVGAGGRLVSVHSEEQAARLRAEGWRVRGGRVQGRDVPGLPASVWARSGTMQDVGPLTLLIAASERADVGMVEITREDVEAEWSRPSFDPRRDAVLVHEGARLVAGAEVYRARRAQVVVHPRHRGRGLGSALLTWSEHTASAQGGSKVGQTVADVTPGAAALFEARGYRPLWNSWILSIELTDPSPAPTLPPGVAIRGFRPQDAEATHRVIEDAFGEWPERESTSYEDWAAVSIHRPSFRPELLRVAVDDRDAVLGTALCVDEGGDEGWVQQLAVRRAWRGRGLGRALLQDAFRLFHDLGRTTCGLNTDSRTGALGLYEHIGMRVTRSYTHWAKDLRPGGRPEGPTIMKRP